MTTLNILFRLKLLPPNKWCRYPGPESSVKYLGKFKNFFRKKKFYPQTPGQSFLQMRINGPLLRSEYESGFWIFKWEMLFFLPARHTYKACGCHFNWQQRTSALQLSWEDPAKNLLQPNICKGLIWHISF